MDWYEPAVLVTLYAEDAGGEAWLEDLGAGLLDRPEVQCLLVQRRYLEKAPVEVCWGEVPEQAREMGLLYALKIGPNQNHGFFLDMRPGREWVREHAAGKRVLNLFSYTCALSVAAIAGGAEEVLNLDLSRRALTTGRESHRLNFNDVRCRDVRYLGHDLFKSWGRIKRHGPYQMVLIDPPSHQPGSFVARKDYARVLRRLPDVIDSKSADILVCLNAPELDDAFLHRLMQEYVPGAYLVERLDDPPGYVESHMERRLKRFVYRLSEV